MSAKRCPSTAAPSDSFRSETSDDEKPGVSIKQVDSSCALQNVCTDQILHYLGLCEGT